MNADNHRIGKHSSNNDAVNEKPTETGLPKGDPGVGGLLADPQDPSPDTVDPDPVSDIPTPDPEPPIAHGDWAPQHEWRGDRPKKSNN